MLNPEAVPTIPAGPIETAPCGERPEEELETTLRDTLQAAGVQLGAYDERAVRWLALWEWPTVATIASWIQRAADHTTQEPPR